MARPTQTIAAQAAMLPGLQFALQTALDNINDARLALKMSPLELSDERTAPVQHTPAPFLRGEIHAKPKKRRRMSTESRDKLRAATQERWDLVRKAGIKMTGRVPSAADVQKAQKLLARRAEAKTAARETKAKAAKPARAAAARKKAPAASAAAA